MSQFRSQTVSSTVVSGGGGKGVKKSICTKGFGHSNASPDSRDHHGSSKTKIPKSLRYDLDNALVGLCDVWFEEIKPHLERNKIKVHVHDTDADADAAGGSCVSGDSALPSGCSHLDSGADRDLPAHQAAASCASCCSTRRRASRVQSHKLPLKRPPPVSLSHQNQCSKFKTNAKWRPAAPVQSSQQYPGVAHSTSQMLTAARSAASQTQSRARRKSASRLTTPRYDEKYIQCKGKPTIKYQVTQTSGLSELPVDLKPKLSSTGAMIPYIKGCVQSSQCLCSHTHSKTYKARRKKLQQMETPSLFPTDLINIISFCYHKQFKNKTNYQCNDELSLMNLKPKKTCGARGDPLYPIPWR